MITLLAITTAVSFVLFIWAAVQIVVLERILKRVRQCAGRLRETLGDTMKERDGAKDALSTMSEAYADLTIKHKKELACVAEAVKAERTAEQAMQATRMKNAAVWAGKQACRATTASWLLDEFLAKYATEETAEPEDDSDREFFLPSAEPEEE